MAPRVVVVLAMVLIVILGGISISRFLVADDDEFARKQECSKYVATVEKKLKESSFAAPDLSSSQSNTLLEMFYSPKNESCLYVWEQALITSSGDIFFYTLTDALSGQIILRTEGLMVGQPDFFAKKQAFFDAIKQFH